MATHKFTDSVVENDDLTRLEALLYAVQLGPDIVAGCRVNEYFMDTTV